MASVPCERPFPVYAGGSQGCGQIPRIKASDITSEEFERKYINRGMPVIITGMMDEWPGYKQGSDRKWSVEFFRRVYGSTTITVDCNGSKESMSFSEYFDRFEEYEKLPAGTPIPYLRTWYFEDDIPELVNDFIPPEHFHRTDAFRKLPKDLRPPFQWLFFGPKGTESKLHVDVWETDAWLGMLQGIKTFTLFHPAHRKYIEREHNEWADLMHPVDLSRFPNQNCAVAAQAEVAEGEVIYIPRKWPHHAVAQSASISLTLNFAPPAAKAGIVEHLLPYIKSRGRCQAVLGRVLRAQDNLMQLCIHGGTIRYNDFNETSGQTARADDNSGLDG